MRKRKVNHGRERHPSAAVTDRSTRPQAIEIGAAARAIPDARPFEATEAVARAGTDHASPCRNVARIIAYGSKPASQTEFAPLSSGRGPEHGHSQQPDDREDDQEDEE